MQNYRYNMPERDYHSNRTMNTQTSQPHMPPCASTQSKDCLASLPIAMAYVPWQKWEKIQDLEKGFHHGTIFEELDKPFMFGKGGVC